MSEAENILTEQEWVDVARDLIVNQNDIENACLHYFKAQELNPNNAEAEFFADYLGYKQLLEENEKLTALVAFKAMAKCVASAIAEIKEYKGAVNNQLAVASTVANIFTPLTRYISIQLLAQGTGAVEGVLGLYALGDALNEHFGDNPMAIDLAVAAWKEGVLLQQMFFYLKYGGITAEGYAEKIKQVEPNYIVPKKNGCTVGGISFRL